MADSLETAPIAIGKGHTHVRCMAAADRPQAHVSHRVAWYDADGKEVRRSSHLTHCSGARPSGKSPAGMPLYVDPKAQDIAIPDGAAGFLVADVKASAGARAKVDATSVPLEAD